MREDNAAAPPADRDRPAEVPPPQGIYEQAAWDAAINAGWDDAADTVRAVAIAGECAANAYAERIAAGYHAGQAQEEALDLARAPFLSGNLQT